MKPQAAILPKLKTLARGEPSLLAAWLREPVTLESVTPLILAIIAGCAAYGFGLGLWRAPLQGVYVAIKMPLLIFFTLLVNGMINGMLGQLLGSGMSFRQTLMACLMSFAIFGLIVGSLSPIIIAMVMDSPRPGQAGASDWYRLFLLFNTAIIAFAGIVANHKLLRLIQSFSGSTAIGWRTLISWLAGNLFVGAQLSYNLRPFFGNPELPVQFLRDDPFDGNFYEAVWTMLSSATDSITSIILWLCLLALILPMLLALKRFNAP
ncbi:MAG: hypothetical protein NTV80_21000 [Verrucomicrobia bacterium]|jgi:hypothetical protein|nr:hypothetical protein [Verrucomicrobiota bacterium]